MRVFIQVFSKTGKPVKHIKTILTKRVIVFLTKYNPFYISKQGNKLYLKVFEEF